MEQHPRVHSATFLTASTPGVTGRLQPITTADSGPEVRCDRLYGIRYTVSACRNNPGLIHRLPLDYLERARALVLVRQDTGKDSSRHRLVTALHSA